MKDIYHLIPRPAAMTVSDTRVGLASFRTLFCPAAEGELIAALQARFPGVTIREEGGHGFSLCLTNGDTIPAAATPEALPDAYVLQVTSDGVRIDAGDAAGLFYGGQTLLQLPDECPCLTIRDHAATSLRMIHWDLKGYLPRFEVLKEELRRLARYKVNAILLELEDKYAYRCAPDIAVSGAYTYEQLRELSQLAKSLHITIVPKLQSIAHVDYILKHPRYAPLREGGEHGYVFQFCPMNPDVHTLWKAMCAELMECFSEHAAQPAYFHIGGDESGNLGECPVCKRLGAAQVYLSRIDECIDFVCEQGWTPILWDDIVRNAGRHFSSEEQTLLRSRLGQRAILMYWEYGYGGQGNTFPYVDEYRSAGLRVWGAGGYGGCDNWSGSIPPLDIRALNCDAWATAAAEKSLECVCATGWTRIGSADCPAEPQESAWFAILYAAAGLWNPAVYDLDTFIRRASMELYGKEPEAALIAAIRNIDKSPYDYHTLWKNPDETADQLQFLRYAAAAECVLLTLNRLQAFLGYYHGKLGNRMEDYRLPLLKRMTRENYDGLIRFRDELREVMSRYYEEVTVEEFVRTRLGYPLHICEEAVSLVEKTTAY